MKIGPEALEEVPIPDDGYERAIAAGNRELRWRRAGLAASCTLLALFMIAGVLALRDPQDARLSTAAPVPPAPTTQAPMGAPLLTLPASALAATPAVPAGWQAVAYGFGQVAVPGDWKPLLNATCFITVPVVFLGDTTFAPEGCAAPSAFLRLTSATNACNDTQVLPLGCTDPRTVNGLAVQTINPGKCAPCDTASYFVADLQLRIDLTNVDTTTNDLILSTLTPSSQARVLANGPVADTTSWRQTNNQPIAIWTPNTWPTKQLTATDYTPGSCGSHPLSGSRETVMLGRGGQTTACPPVSGPGPPAHVDGVWIPPLSAWSTERPQAEVVAAGSRQVRIAAPAGPDFLVLEVQVADNKQATVIVGIGPQLAVARAIVRSITVNGQPLAGAQPVPATTNLPSPTPDELKAADDTLRRQQANGWVPYAGDPLIPGTKVPNPAWARAEQGGQSLVDVAKRADCTRPPSVPEPLQFFCVYDTPDDHVVGYHIANGGYVATDRLNDAQVKGAVVDRLQRLLDSGTSLPPEGRAAIEQRIKELQSG